MTEQRTLEEAKNDIGRLKRAASDLEAFVDSIQRKSDACLTCRQNRRLAEEAEERAAVWEERGTSEIEETVVLMIDRGYISSSRGWDLVSDLAVNGHHAASNALREALFKRIEDRYSTPPPNASLPSAGTTAVVMNLDPEKLIRCDSEHNKDFTPHPEDPKRFVPCGYEGPLKDWKPSGGVYSDIACPECGSTRNAHNREFMAQIQQRAREQSAASRSQPG